MNRIEPGFADSFSRRVSWVANRPLFDAFSLVPQGMKAQVLEAFDALNLARGRHD
jgi:hypothetical protein